MSKWIKKLRALPSDPLAEDNLKVEYIEENLKNSRVLISSVKEAAIASQILTENRKKAVENLLPLRSAREDLSWLDGLIKRDPSYTSPNSPEEQLPS